MSFLFLFSILTLTIPAYTNAVSFEIHQLLKKPDSLAFYNSQIAHASANKYCHICCIELQESTVGKKCGSHTMCRFENQTIGPACKGLIPVKLTPTEKRLIVDAHNTLRNSVASGKIQDGAPGPQPPAANMRAVEWNNELAMIADRWASQCIFANDICRDVEKFPVGQNIARGTISTDQELNLLEKWFQEVRFFNKNLVDSFALPTNGGPHYARYSQMVWADTYLIGCARVMFQVNEGSKIHYTEHIFCNYGPTGNIPKQRIYKIGPPCSECQEGTACNSEYGALCATDSTDTFDDYLLNNMDANRLPRKCASYYNVFLCFSICYIRLFKLLI